MNAITLFNALTAMGVSVPRMQRRSNTLVVFEGRHSKADRGIAINDTDAIYIMCGVMETEIAKDPKVLDFHVEHCDGRYAVRIFYEEEDGKSMWEDYPQGIGETAATKHEALIECLKAVQA